MEELDQQKIKDTTVEADENDSISQVQLETSNTAANKTVQEARSAGIRNAQAFLGKLTLTGNGIEAAPIIPGADETGSTEEQAKSRDHDKKSGEKDSEGRSATGPTKRDSQGKDIESSPEQKAEQKQADKPDAPRLMPRSDEEAKPNEKSAPKDNSGTTKQPSKNDQSPATKNEPNRNAPESKVAGTAEDRGKIASENGADAITKWLNRSLDKRSKESTTQRLPAEGIPLPDENVTPEQPIPALEKRSAPKEPLPFPEEKSAPKERVPSPEEKSAPKERVPSPEERSTPKEPARESADKSALQDAAPIPGSQKTPEKEEPVPAKGQEKDKPDPPRDNVTPPTQTIPLEEAPSKQRT
jgi:hypothetical protein